MRFRRVWVVYRKELVEALRDRRTLTAMLLVPLLLYPVLMVVIIQALQIEKGRRERQSYAVAVADETHRRWLMAVFAADERTTSTNPAEAAPADQFHATIRPTQFDVVVRQEALDEVVRRSEAQVGLRVEPPVPKNSLGESENRAVWLFYDPSEYRSETAFRGLRQVLERQAERTIIGRLQRVGLTADTLEPLRVRESSVATPRKLGGALLGQILPFLLVIMTVTGAIYPAIDLTAGERERGTLETLMVAPLPIGQIVAGKFLVVVTIAILSTTLNLVSMGATIRFGGIASALTRAAPGASEIVIPTAVLPIILLAMLPFAVLFSAVMLATCSFARTFKEAQNYMTPVMIGALIPAMITTYMPSIRLSGPVTVIPVANVVVLLRELFLGHHDIPAIVLTIGSTTFYAATAVVVAARLYGQEAVIFADVGSYRAILRRRFIRPAAFPSPTAALLLVALLFPLSFYWQTSFATPDMSASRLAVLTVVLLLACFLAPTLAVAWYCKLDLRTTFSLRAPSPRSLVATVLIASAMPVLAQALAKWIQAAVPMSPEISRAFAEQEVHMLQLSVGARLATFALLPAICEELLFRGFLLAGLRHKLRPLTLCLVVGVIFGLFHADFYRIPTSSLMGAILAYLCWRSGSILPAMIVHAFNNGVALLAARQETLARWLGMTDHAPSWVVPVAAGVLLVGLFVLRAEGTRREVSPGRAMG